MNYIYKLFGYKKNNDDNGYTLIELLGVIVVLSIVISIVIGFGMNIINNAKKKSYNVTINNIEDQASNYVLENVNSIYWDEISSSNIEYTCVSVNDLIDTGYFKNDVLDSYVDDNTKVNKDNQIYIQRNKNNKNIEKEVLLVGSSIGDYKGLCSPALDKKYILFDISPDGWSNYKDVSIKYEIRNNTDNLSNYTYGYYYFGEEGFSSQDNIFDKNIIVVNVTEDKKITKEGSLVAKIGEYQKTVDIRLDTEGPVINKGNYTGDNIVFDRVTIPIKLSDDKSGIKSDSFTLTDIVVSIGDNVIDNGITLDKINDNNYNLVITNNIYDGLIKLKIEKDMVFDNAENGNEETNIDTGISFLGKFNIKYDPNGGVGSMEDTECKYMESCKLNTNIFTNKDYKFLGWSENKNSKYATYTDGYKFESYDMKKDITLYAIWKVKTAYAIYSDSDKSLRFYKNYDIPKEGDTYNGRVITKIYMDVEDIDYDGTSTIPWYDKRENITKVIVEEEINPLNTIYWFGDFVNCSSLNLIKLDTSKVTSMELMFLETGNNVINFNIIGLDDWDVSNVTDMRGMFWHTGGEKATIWNIGDLSNWDTSNVTDMELMFDFAGSNATTFNIGNIGNWDVSNVTDMSYMFTSAGNGATTWNIGDLSEWDTSNVTNMESMFSSSGSNATTFNIGNIDNWDVSNVTDMSSMFGFSGRNATTWNIGDLSEWDVSKVTDMSRMFSTAGQDTTRFNIGNLDSWNVSNVINMYAMFAIAGGNSSSFNIGKLDNWDTSNVTNMGSMFADTGGISSNFDIGDLSKWDVSKVTDMRMMFYFAGRSASSFNIGKLDNWDTSNVTDMSYMFEQSGNNATNWYIGDISKWDVSNVTNMNRMFRDAGRKVSVFNIGNLGNWDTSNVTNMNMMFYGAGSNATSFNIGKLDNWDTSKVTDMSGLFAFIGLNATTWNIGDLSGWDVSNVTNMYYMFYRAGSSATSVDIGNLDNWNVSNVTNMDSMFTGVAETAGSFNIGDLSGWDVSKVTTMRGMFYSLGAFAYTWSVGDLSGWDTSNVTNMWHMFATAGYYRANYKLNLSGWDVSKVIEYTNFNVYVTDNVIAPKWVHSDVLYM